MPYFINECCEILPAVIKVKEILEADHKACIKPEESSPPGFATSERRGRNRLRV
jgi:hypothetical protein